MSKFSSHFCPATAHSLPRLRLHFRGFQLRIYFTQGKRILGNGNPYIIELDEEKADPYYLAAFFGSEQGTAALRSITVGATIPNIGVEQLTKLVIPIPPLEKQKEIADKYKTVKDEITMLQLKLEKAKNRMAHIIEEGGANNA